MTPAMSPPRVRPAIFWWAVLTGTLRRTGRHNLSALAAAVAYYALMSLFPALTALVSVYGLVSNRTIVQHQLDTMAVILPPEVLKLVASWLTTLVDEPHTRFGVGLILGLLLAAWSIWSATAMLMTAVNTCYGDVERRSFLRFNLEAIALGIGFALLAVLALALVALLPVVLALLPLAPAWSAAISLLRWPLLAGLALLGLAIIYRYGPARIDRTWRWVSWGAAIATALWLVGSVGFAAYVSRIGSYDRTYGSLGAVIVLLLWFYMSAYVVLIGAELNGELERRAAGG